MTRPTASPGIRHIALSLLALALIALLVWFSGVTLGEITSVIGQIPLWFLATVALGQAVIVLLATIKWVHLLKMTGAHELGIGSATAATTLGTLVGQFLPIQVVTPALRAWIARRDGIGARQAVGTSLFEQVFELIVLAAAFAVGLTILMLGASPGLGIGVSGLVLVLLIGLVRPGLRLLRALLMILPGRLSARIAEGVATASQLPNRSLVVLTLLSIVRYLIMAGLTVGGLLFLVPGLDPIPVIIGFPVILLLTALPFLPAGLGPVEVTWMSLLAAQGIDLSEGAAVALALRLIMLAGFLAATPVLLAPLLARREQMP